MLDPIVRFFTAPPGENRAATVRSRLLSRVLNVHILISLAIAVLYPDDTPARGVVANVSLALVPMGLALRMLLHRGMAVAASWTFLIVLSVVTSALSMILAGSVALMSTTVVQMTTIIMAGLLLGPFQAILFSIAQLVGNGFMFAVEARHVPDRASGLEAAWIIQTIFYLGASALLSRAVALTSDALDLAGREADERRAVEAALRESVERYRLITTVSSDYVFSTVLSDTATQLRRRLAVSLSTVEKT